MADTTIRGWRWLSAGGEPRLFEELGDLGIEPIFFDTVGYNPTTDAYDPAGGKDVLSISGSQILETLKSRTPVADWIMRDIVQDVLHAEIAAGRPILYE